MSDSTSQTPQRKSGILDFLKESNGQFSSSRLFSFLIVVATMVDWMHAVFATPAGIWKPEIQTIVMVLGVLGFKVTQKFAEEKVNEVNQKTSEILGKDAETEKEEAEQK